MKLPLSWLKDYVDIDLSVEDLARVLTRAGLEVDSIQLVGLAAETSSQHEFKINGLTWEADKIVVAQIDEVMPHPNADRLVLCHLNDGIKEQVVLTGAPNLFQYRGTGPLPTPLKVAYAREGARIYDGHQPGQVLTTLKRAKIRGIESYSMVCSEKELGISDEHEGIILLDADAPTGMPLVDYMGDAVFEISILPNMIRNACVVGVAREVAAMTGRELRLPPADFHPAGPAIAGRASIKITNPELNPRFVLGLIENVTPQPSPYKIQLRLRLAGMRPINHVVDATNYLMLELGEPLHAFDYDVLLKRAGGKAPVIITRTANPGEHLTTLDDVDRALEPFTVLVCDEAGALSIAGVMGGQESEVTPATRNILLEGASWNFINIRKTVSYLHLQSEAAYRFSRGIHPDLAPWGVQLCLKRMSDWGEGVVASGLIDNYPAPITDPVVTLTEQDVTRILGIQLSAAEIAALLRRLDFTCTVEGSSVVAKTPPHRLDVGEGVVGKADLLEEVARIYGYDNIPARRMTDALPPMHPNPVLETEAKVREQLVVLGLQEVITYRLTCVEREARILPPGADAPGPYITLKNPIAPERSLMRRHLLASVMEIVERNARLREHLAFFEIGPVFFPRDDDPLPDEPTRLAIAMTGKRDLAGWDGAPSANLDFYDLKAVIESLLESLHISGVTYTPAAAPSYHPGKCAEIRAGDVVLGVMGELHPLVRAHYDLGASSAPVLAAELYLERFNGCRPARVLAQPVPVFPPVLEDLAVVVDESTPSAVVEEAIRAAGGKLVTAVRLFDIFRGEQLGAGKKSLAYSLTYQLPDRTLTDSDTQQVRQRIIRRLEQDLGAKLRA